MISKKTPNCSHSTLIDANFSSAGTLYEKSFPIVFFIKYHDYYLSNLINLSSYADNRLLIVTIY